MQDDAMTSAGREVRNELSIKLFERCWDELNENERMAVKSAMFGYLYGGGRELVNKQLRRLDNENSKDV